MILEVNFASSKSVTIIKVLLYLNIYNVYEFIQNLKKKNLFSLYLILEIVMHNSNKDYDDEIQRT